ncbi:MAG: GNAT family N-acetyltransferase [Ilumatobacteraceae bacterium]
MVDIRTATPDDWPAMSFADARAFGSSMSADDREDMRTVIEFDRFRLAVEDGQIVGLAGAWTLEMTLPGGATVPTGGVTWVSVAVTHRRRGVMSALLGAVHEDIDAHGEPLAALNASEGGIYERFGYGIATRRRTIAIDRHRAQLMPRLRPTGGTVRIVDPLAALPEIMDVWDRYRRRRAGEIGRPEVVFRLDVALNPHDVHVLHADGYACWRFEQTVAGGLPELELTVVTMAAVTDEAHVALWDTVLSTDLVGPIRSSTVPPDDPLPYLLADQRAVRTTNVTDRIWCNVRDVAGCFDARAYGTDDDVVVEVDGVRWRLGASGTRKVRTRPDLVTDRAGLGALVLGGEAPTTLVAGRRMEATTASALRRADALFVVHPAPYSQSGF